MGVLKLSILCVDTVILSDPSTESFLFVFCQEGCFFPPQFSQA